MRIRPIMQFLLSSVALPAVAGDYSVCFSATDSLSCIIEQSEFARQRNAEIDASMARVERARAQELALSLTHCKTWYSRTPRCLAERADRFAEHQNALIEASMTRVAAARAFDAARQAEIAASMAAVEKQRSHRLEIQQNALIEASIAAANAERDRRFAAHQNALSTASIARVEIERRWQYALQQLPCTGANDARPRCQIERARRFAAHQNALATASADRVAAERARAFAAARNAEVERSLAAVANARASSAIETATLRNPANATNVAITAQEYAELTSHCVRAPESPRCEAERIREFAAARNAEINASIVAVAAERAHSNQYAAFTSHCAHNADSPRCEAERIREFAAARNEEINRSLAAVAAARASGQLTSDILANGHGNPATGTSPLETGAISLPPVLKAPSMRLDRESQLRLNNISTDPCQTSTKQFDALTFSRGAVIEVSMQPELDRLASLTQTCPGMRIEVHGYADGGAHFNNRDLSQERAQAVTDYLIAAGVSPNRVSAIGRGGSHPVLPYSKGYAPAFGGRAELVVRDPSTDAAARRVMWDLAELLDPTYIPAVANLSP
jgi:outer membrane protein OmpA-like peptidoglycan-associated protein